MRYYNRKSCAECFQATKACDLMSCWQRSTCCWSLMGWEAWCSADTNAVTALWSRLCLAMAVAGQKVLWFSESHCASVQLQDEAPKTFNSCYVNLQISFWDITLEEFSCSKWPQNRNKSAASITCEGSTERSAWLEEVSIQAEGMLWDQCD